MQSPGSWGSNREVKEMIHLIDVDEENWIDIVRLKVKDEQQKYLDRPIGIIARVYIS